MKLFPAFKPTKSLPPDLQKELAALGIDPDNIPELCPYVVGISSAFGIDKDAQAEIDAWIENGGNPFESSRRYRKK